MVTTRKHFLTQAAGAGAALCAGPFVLQEAAAAAPPAHQSALSARATATLAAWGDVLVPGAAAAGVSDFVNAQLAKRPGDTLLGLRYFDVPPPYAAFYDAGLRALDEEAERGFARRFLALTGVERRALLERLFADDSTWSGPPYFLFYLVTRSDAVDVVYGTPEGYARIGYPYVPQVVPPRPW